LLRAPLLLVEAVEDENDGLPRHRFERKQARIANHGKDPVFAVNGVRKSNVIRSLILEMDGHEEVVQRERILGAPAPQNLVQLVRVVRCEALEEFGVEERVEIESARSDFCCQTCLHSAEHTQNDREREQIATSERTPDFMLDDHFVDPSAIFQALCV
jgi:hypothetical protein